MRTAFIAAVLFGASAAAAAAATLVPAAAPRITDAAAVVDYTPDFGGQFLALALAPVSDTPALAPFDVQIDGALADPAFAPVLTVTDEAGGALLAGAMTVFSVSPDGVLSLVFDVTADPLGLFGAQALAVLRLGLGPNPFAAPFSVTASATVTPAVAPVPAPAAALLLLGGLAMLARAGRRQAGSCDAPPSSL